METTSYQELLDSRTKYDEMLARLGIIQKHNRWVEAYKLVAELEENRKSDSPLDIDRESKAKMMYALTDLHNLSMILDQFKDEESEVFKIKFGEMLKGSLNPIQEINTSSIARDTQFELLMCARFREVGLKSYLGKLHPDVVIVIDGVKYGFECKRIFNFNTLAVQKNIEKAIDQLYRNFVRKEYRNRGMPLICLDRYVTGGNTVLYVKNEDATRIELNRQIQVFVDEHYRLWNGKKAKDERIIGVLLYMNITTILQDEGMQVVSQQFGLSNNGWAGVSKEMFDDFKYNIASLLGPMDTSEVS